MEINYDIYRQAKNIIKKREELHEYIDACMKSRICPKCGKNNLKRYEMILGYECLYCNWKSPNLINKENRILKQQSKGK